MKSEMPPLAALRFGFRRLWKFPVHSAVAVLTLALGIGLTTAMYAIVEGTFLRGLPFADADRIVRVERVAADGDSGRGVHGGRRPSSCGTVRPPATPSRPGSATG